MAAGLMALAIVAVFSIPQIEFVIVREGQKEYHRPGCPVVRDGKGVLAMSRGEAEAKQMKPHADCDPANPRNAGQAQGGGPVPAKPVYVFTDSTSYYHREKCPKLKNGAKRVSLDAAARKHWPCRTCKPPIRPRKSKMGNGKWEMGKTPDWGALPSTISHLPFPAFRKSRVR